jgi:hypothetical protein
LKLINELTKIVLSEHESPFQSDQQRCV